MGDRRPDEVHRQVAGVKLRCGAEQGGCGNCFDVGVMASWYLHQTGTSFSCPHAGCSRSWSRDRVEEILGKQSGEVRKKAGLDLVERNAGKWMDRVRAAARDLSRRDGSVSADGLRQWAKDHNDPPHDPNAWEQSFAEKGGTLLDVRSPRGPQTTLVRSRSGLGLHPPKRLTTKRMHRSNPDFAVGTCFRGVLTDLSV